MNPMLTKTRMSTGWIVLAMLVLRSRCLADNLIPIASFDLSGALALPPVVSKGSATGTIYLSGQDSILLSMHYEGLSSDLTQVAGYFGVQRPWTGDGHLHNGASVGFFSGTLPPSGNLSITRPIAAWLGQNTVTPAVLDSIRDGLGYMYVTTRNHPFALYGEIGGQIRPASVPEPTAIALAVVGVSILVSASRRRNSRRNSSKRPLPVTYGAVG